MIRPLTVATFLLACGSGLYLYQSKHEVQLLDRTIERTVHETGALREQSRLLAAEWTILNDPERLRRFSDTYLALKTITPTQFTSLADLGNRLPAPLADAPAHGADEPEAIPDVSESASPTSGSMPATASDEVLPVPPIPATPPVAVAAAAAHPADTRTAPSHAAVVDSQPHAAALEVRPAEQRVARVADAHAEVRPPAAPPATVSLPSAPVSAAVSLKPIILAAPRSSSVAVQAPQKSQMNVSPMPAPSFAPVQSRSAMVAASGPYTGSLLGMAHGSAPSVPRPTPVNATYNAN